ncbi:sigma-70 family RNA polymerase sigma factor, partial [Streptomyces sp. NPDC051582]|uniref:RNA polymerase sigma factor n=1 Tax=Streptomyces sp. NPDC051582 TaxID=3155167 RepID=UPI0034125F6D
MGDFRVSVRPSDPVGLPDEELTTWLRSSGHESVPAEDGPEGSGVTDDAARAMAELYRRHRDPMIACARSLTGVQEAEDVASEAFLRTVHAVRRGAGPTGPWRPYLLTVVRNTASELGKAQRGQVPLADFQTWCESLPDATDPERLALYSEETRLLGRAFHSLPQNWQAVLWHRRVNERTTSYVAELLGLTPKGVASLLARAEEGLRKAYLQAHVHLGDDAECRYYSGVLGSAVRSRISKNPGLIRHLGQCDRCSTAFADLSYLNAKLRALAPLALFLVGEGVAGHPAFDDVSSSTAITPGGGRRTHGGGRAVTARGEQWAPTRPWLLGTMTATAVAGIAVAASTIGFVNPALTSAGDSGARPLPGASSTPSAPEAASV